MTRETTSVLRSEALRILDGEEFPQNVRTA